MLAATNFRLREKSPSASCSRNEGQGNPLRIPSAIVSDACRLCPRQSRGPSNRLKWTTVSGHRLWEGLRLMAKRPRRRRREWAAGIQASNWIGNSAGIADGYVSSEVMQHDCRHRSHNSNEAPVDTEENKEVALWFFIVRGAVLAPHSLTVLSRKRGDSWQQPRIHNIVKMTNRKNRPLHADTVDFRLPFGKMIQRKACSSRLVCNVRLGTATNGNGHKQR